MAVVVRGKRREKTLAFQLCIKNLLIKRSISANNLHIEKRMLVRI